MVSFEIECGARPDREVGGGLTLNGALSPHSLRGLPPGVTHCSRPDTPARSGGSGLHKGFVLQNMNH